MKKIDKLIEKMRNQPSGIRFEEMEYVLAKYEYQFDRQNGSHRSYVNQSGAVMTIPKANTVKRVYIERILS